MKAKGVNWRRWARLLKFMKTRKPREINMAPVLDTNHSGACVLKELRAEGAHCGTVGCMAGWGAVLWTKDRRILTDGEKMVDTFKSNLNLDYGQIKYVVNGYWAGEGMGYQQREELGKREVIRYMTKALKAKDVMVRL